MRKRKQHLQHQTCAHLLIQIFTDNLYPPHGDFYHLPQLPVMITVKPSNSWESSCACVYSLLESWVKLNFQE